MLDNVLSRSFCAFATASNLARKSEAMEDFVEDEQEMADRFRQ